MRKGKLDEANKFINEIMVVASQPSFLGETVFSVDAARKP